MGRVETFYQDPQCTLYKGDALEVLKVLPDESVHTVCTSPPYWNLRKYEGQQIVKWEDGTECSFGLEPSVELYIQHSVEVLREIRRVMRDDAVCWWNIDDSYAGSNNGSNDYRPEGSSLSKNSIKYQGQKPGLFSGLKPLNLCLIPQRLAIEAQKPYEIVTIKKPEDRAWLAAMVDGEGTVGIHHLDKGTYHQFEPFVGVGNSDLILIEQCVKVTGMGGSRQKVEAGHTDNRQIHTRRAHYEWRLEGENAIKVLKDIYPYLIVKERQARIANELWDIQQSTKDLHKGKGHKLPEAIVNRKLELWNLCKACNQRRDVTVNLPPLKPHIESGWYVRSWIVWSKNNPMPESVRGVRWEKHKVKMKGLRSERIVKVWSDDANRKDKFAGGDFDKDPWNEYQDCPGCPKCNPNDGYVLRQGSWRPTRSHEYILMLTKTASYWADGEAVRETLETPLHAPGNKAKRFDSGRGHNWDEGRMDKIWGNPAGRNLRDVWEFSTQNFSGAHFATFPERLVEISILASTSEAGVCSKCGKQWARVIDRSVPPRLDRQVGSLDRNDPDRPSGKELSAWYAEHPDQTLGFRPTCSCHAERAPATVLDPFSGSGTVGVVAKKLGRKSILIDISEEYCRIAQKRIEVISLPMGE